VVIGGVEQQTQAKQLARRPHVVIATPGRLAELIDTDPGLRRGFAKARWIAGLFSKPRTVHSQQNPHLSRAAGSLTCS
jgi:hypothetical protein